MTMGIFAVGIYAPSIYAQSTSENEALWRNSMGGAIIGHPLAEMDTVVLITDGGGLRAYSSQGRSLWDYYVRGRLSPFLSRTREGTSYIARNDGLLVAINRAGRELFQIHMGSPLTHPLLIGWDGRLFIFTEGRISCITASGYTLWTRSLDKNIVLDPFLDISGGIVLIMEDGEVRRYDPFGSHVSYVYMDLSMMDPSTGNVPVTATSLYIRNRGPSILLLYEDRQIELIYMFPSQGEAGYGVSLRGVLELPYAPLKAVGSGNRSGEAAVLLADGRLSLLSLDYLETLWIRGSHIRASDLGFPQDSSSLNYRLIADERGVYLLSRSGGTAHAYNGDRIWTINFPHSGAVPAFGHDGILYSGGNDWILYAYQMEEPNINRQGSIYGPQAPGIYGQGFPSASFFQFENLPNEAEINRRLSEIRAAIEAGNIGERENEYKSWLMEISGIYIYNPVFLRHPPISVFHRAEAASLLSFIGSRENIAFLTSIFVRDPDPNVKAAAALSIGRIGVDPERLAIRAFSNTVFPPSPETSEVILTAIAEATGALCRFSGPPLSDEGIRILAALSTSNRPPLTRRQALREINSF